MLYAGATLYAGAAINTLEMIRRNGRLTIDVYAYYYAYLDSNFFPFLSCSVLLFFQVIWNQIMNFIVVAAAVVVRVVNFRLMIFYDNTMMLCWIMTTVCLGGMMDGFRRLEATINVPTYGEFIFVVAAANSG